MSSAGGDRNFLKKLHQLTGQTEETGENSEESSWLVSYADMMTLLVGFFIILMSLSSIDQSKFEIVKKMAVKEFGGSYHVPFETITARIRDSIQKMGLGDQFSIVQTDLGIEVSMRGTVFFDLGSLEMRPEGKALIERIIPMIKAESTEFDILIEGHTDDVPIGTHLSLLSNWELSSVRACRVLDVFEKNGFEKSRLTAVGYGEARPIFPNRDPQGQPIPSNQGQNRRVVIKILKKSLPMIGNSKRKT